MSFHVIIPARLKSSRLPRKVLLDIGNKSMVRRVYEQACLSQASSVTIAVDDEEVFQHVKRFTEHVIMTRATHPTGTDRLAEAAELLGLTNNQIIVNVQGDEPFIPPILLDQVASLLNTHTQTVMATLCEPIDHIERLFDPNTVKVVMNDQSEALYFSRAPIPWQRGVFHYDIKNINIDLANQPYYRHIGLYAYRTGFLKSYVHWPTHPIEQIEQLEQLRILMRGERISVALAKAKSPIGVDTEDDLIMARKLCI